MAGGKKYYVVFSGRRLGIFNQWSECHTQVVRFKGSAFESYPTLEKAEAAWAKFCKEAEGAVEMEEPKETSKCTPGPSSNTEVSLEGLSLQDDGLGNNPKPNDFLIEYSNEALLRDVCKALQVPPPSLSLLESKVIDGVLQHRYFACVAWRSVETAPVLMVGDFNASHDEALDSASWMMLHHLVQKVGKPIKDYNFHVVDQLVAEMTVKDDQIATMAGEIAILEHEISTLKEAIGLP